MGFVEVWAPEEGAEDEGDEWDAGGVDEEADCEIQSSAPPTISGRCSRTHE